ncbi:MAG: hypothetical protein KatS3mg081_2379 [Gemmatimonadales bacterium]|nr:hypothetical protein HRbin33_00866 [bacterium HR33]GIW53024.1 MAG: hypothetical protein KatS3mg081_2379 [Gemmatimonadales bacterium]
MGNKVRTQVQLDRRQYERLKEIAFRRGSSLSAALRALLDEALGLQPQPPDPKKIREIRLAFVGSGRDSARDVARHHDRYLYGGR